MHTPTKQQFTTVIDTLKTVLPMAATERNFDMTQGMTFFADGHQCGTTHCIGGWYLIAKNPLDKYGRDFLDGADLMAEDLGFIDHVDFEYWARRNVRTWGNDSGGTIFSSCSAYNNSKTLADAITHLESVRDRLPN